MKKLLLSILCAFTLLTFATPVYALDSIGGIGADSEDGSVTVDNITSPGDPQAKDLNKNPEKLQDYVSGVEGFSLLSYIREISYTPVDFNGKVTFTVELPEATSTQNLRAIVRSGNGWVSVQASSGNGEVTFSIDLGKFGITSPLTFGIIKQDDVVSSETSTEVGEVGGWDDGGPFTTDECGNVYDRWGNEIYHAPVCVVNGDDNYGYNFVNTSDR